MMFKEDRPENPYQEYIDLYLKADDAGRAEAERDLLQSQNPAARHILTSIFTALEQGVEPSDVINEQHPSIDRATRMLLKNFGGTGDDVIDLMNEKAGGKLIFSKDRNGILLREPNDTKWKRIEPISKWNSLWSGESKTQTKNDDGTTSQNEGAVNFGNLYDRTLGDDPYFSSEASAKKPIFNLDVMDEAIADLGDSGFDLFSGIASTYGASWAAKGLQKYLVGKYGPQVAKTLVGPMLAKIVPKFASPMISRTLPSAAAEGALEFGLEGTRQAIGNATDVREGYDSGDLAAAATIGGIGGGIFPANVGAKHVEDMANLGARGEQQGLLSGLADKVMFGKVPDKEKYYGFYPSIHKADNNTSWNMIAELRKDIASGIGAAKDNAYQGFRRDLTELETINLEAAHAKVRAMIADIDNALTGTVMNDAKRAELLLQKSELRNLEQMSFYGRVDGEVLNPKTGQMEPGRVKAEITGKDPANILPAHDVYDYEKGLRREMEDADFFTKLGTQLSPEQQRRVKVLAPVQAAIRSDVERGLRTLPTPAQESYFKDYSGLSDLGETALHRGFFEHPAVKMDEIGMQRGFRNMTGEQFDKYADHQGLLSALENAVVQQGLPPPNFVKRGRKANALGKWVEGSPDNMPMYSPHLFMNPQQYRFMGGPQTFKSMSSGTRKVRKAMRNPVVKVPAKNETKDEESKRRKGHNEKK